MDRCFHTDGALPTGMKLHLLQIFFVGGKEKRHVLFSLFKQSEENNDRPDAW